MLCVPLVLAAAQSLIVCGGREDTASGLMKIMIKLNTAAAIKRPNIQCEAIRASLRGSSISLGRATAGEEVNMVVHIDKVYPYIKEGGGVAGKRQTYY